MDRRRQVSVALFVTTMGALLFVPPLLQLPRSAGPVFGVPAQLIYVFVVWAALCVAALLLGRRLPRDPPDGGGRG
jgi:hypothetical protein